MSEFGFDHFEGETTVGPGAKIKARAKIGAVKIHGPNSPAVLRGEISLGHREEIEVDEPEQIVELTYEQAAEMFGEDEARRLFARGKGE